MVEGWLRRLLVDRVGLRPGLHRRWKRRLRWRHLKWRVVLRWVTGKVWAECRNLLWVHLLAQASPSVGEPDLNASLSQVRRVRQIFARVHIRILSPRESSLECLELFTIEGRARASLLALQLNPRLWLGVALVRLPENAVDWIIVRNFCFTIFAILLTQQSTNGTHRRRRLFVADAFFDELLADLPWENARILLLHVFDAILDFRCGDARLASADNARSNAAGLLIAIENLRYAAVRHAKLSWDDARSDTSRRQLDNLEADVIWQRSTVDEDTAELIYASLTCKLTGEINLLTHFSQTLFN